MEDKFSSHRYNCLDDLMTRFGDNNIESTIARCTAESGKPPLDVDLDWIISLYDSALHHTDNARSVNPGFRVAAENYKAFEPLFLDSIARIFNNISAEFETYSFAADQNRHEMNIWEHKDAINDLVARYRRLVPVFDGCSVKHSGSLVARYSSFLSDVEQLSDNLARAISRYRSLDLSDHKGLLVFSDDLKRNLFSFRKDLEKRGSKFFGSRNIFSHYEGLSQFRHFESELQLVSDPSVLARICKDRCALEGWVSYAGSFVRGDHSYADIASLRDVPEFQDAPGFSDSVLLSPVVDEAKRVRVQYVQKHDSLMSESRSVVRSYLHDCGSQAKVMGKDSLISLKERVLSYSDVFERFGGEYKPVISMIDARLRQYAVADARSHEISLEMERQRSEQAKHHVEELKLKQQQAVVAEHEARAKVEQAKASIKDSESRQAYASQVKVFSAKVDGLQQRVDQCVTEDADIKQAFRSLDARVSGIESDYYATTESIFHSLGDIEDRQSSMDSRIDSILSVKDGAGQRPAFSMDDYPDYSYTNDLPADHDIQSSRVKHLVHVLKGRFGYFAFEQRLQKASMIMDDMSSASCSDIENLEKVYSGISRCLSEGVLAREVRRGHLDEKSVHSFLQKVDVVRNRYRTAA